MTIRPLHDRILARRIVAQDTTKGGLFIPDNAKEKPMEALVIAIGSGKLLDNGTSNARHGKTLVDLFSRRLSS